jgi:hypothetical protein
MRALPVSVPTVGAKRLGFGCLIPFVVLTLDVWALGQDQRAAAGRVLLGHVTTIATFLGASFWVMGGDRCAMDLLCRGPNSMPALRCPGMATHAANPEVVCPCPLYCHRPKDGAVSGLRAGAVFCSYTACSGHVTLGCWLGGNSLIARSEERT